MTNEAFNSDDYDEVIGEDIDSLQFHTCEPSFYHYKIDGQICHQYVEPIFTPTSSSANNTVIILLNQIRNKMTLQTLTRLCSYLYQSYPINPLNVTEIIDPKTNIHLPQSFWEDLSLHGMAFFTDCIDVPNNIIDDHQSLINTLKGHPNFTLNGTSPLDDISSFIRQFNHRFNISLSTCSILNCCCKQPCFNQWTTQSQQALGDLLTQMDLTAQYPVGSS